MFKIEKLFLGLNNFGVQNFCSDHTTLQLEKVLIYSKLSRYDFERKKNKHFNDKQLEKYLRNRGTDVDKLIYHHDLHKKFEENVASVMKSMGIDAEIINR